MTDLSDLRHRVAALEALTAKQASDIETIAKLAYNVATAVNRNADICTRNFEKIAEPDESEWWKRGGDNDGEGDTGVQAP